MTAQQWRTLGEVEAGDVWAAVLDHPSIETLDRIHCPSHTTLGLLMYPRTNMSRGSFLTSEWRKGVSPLGTVVAIPGGVSLRVQSEAMPERRMLHCRLPDCGLLEADPERLDTCVDLRNDAVSSGLLRMAREAMTPGLGSRAIVEGLGLVIAGELERSFAEKQADVHKGGLAPWQLRRIGEFVRSGNWNGSVSDIAGLCGLSAGHVMRAFRQSTGRSIASYIASMRIDRACALLDEDIRSITEIAADLGFANTSGFSAAFRRSVGMSPRLYRQRRRAGV